MNFLNVLVPEVALVVAAGVLFLLGATRSRVARQATPWIAMAGLAFAAGRLLAPGSWQVPADELAPDVAATLNLTSFTGFIKLLTVLVAMLLALLHWPTDGTGSRNSSLDLANESPEYFGLMLLSVTGVLLVAGANDLILLFLGIELASLPTYVMISISRPIAVAQEASVKYFFLGAFSAALTLLGLTFIFGATGATTLSDVSRMVTASGPGTAFSGWLLAGGVLVILGLAFKMAVFPLHFYALDVYTGAATPLTALLSFIPKITGIAALIRVLFALLDRGQNLPEAYLILLWVMAVASMTIGNVLGLMQHNIKRMMACSSIAHSGYMLAGITVAFTALTAGPILQVRENALHGVMFYLVAYGVMNVGVFAVLMMLPVRPDPFVHDGKVPPATSAETFADIAGTGRRNVGLGLIMAACCFSLIGIPLTVGFLGKLFLIQPALGAHYIWLAVIMVVNAAISAGYYLRIIGTMFLREPRADTLVAASEPAAAGAAGDACGSACMKTMPLVLAGILSAGASLAIGSIVPLTTVVRSTVREAGQVQSTRPLAQPPLQQQSPRPQPQAQSL